MLYLIFIWITNSSDHRRVWTANLFHEKQLLIPLGHKALCPNGLHNYFSCTRFAVPTLLSPLEVVIQINLEHDTIAVWNLARSWTILTKKILKIYLIIALKYFNQICLKPFLTGQKKVFRTACITWLIDILCFVQFLTLYYVKPKSASEKRRWLLASYFRYWSYSNKSCREITRKQLHWYHRKTN